jgi:hypothetical protein
MGDLATGSSALILGFDLGTGNAVRSPPDYESHTDGGAANQFGYAKDWSFLPPQPISPIEAEVSLQN